MICYDLLFVTTYLDDLLVQSKDIHEHVKHLEVLFQRMHDAGLTYFKEANARLDCLLLHTWATSSQQLARLQILKKVSAVGNWPSPNEVGTLRSFLGLASYYHQYIHKFSDIAALLYHLTNKNIPFVWDDLCQLALMHALILKYPDFSSTS